MLSPGTEVEVGLLVRARHGALAGLPWTQAHCPPPPAFLRSALVPPPHGALVLPGTLYSLSSWAVCILQSWQSGALPLPGKDSHSVWRLRQG